MIFSKKFFLSSHIFIRIYYILLKVGNVHALWVFVVRFPFIYCQDGFQKLHAYFHICNKLRQNYVLSSLVHLLLLLFLRGVFVNFHSVGL